MVGGSNYGHMTYLWWSAFDPIFWLHHMNVERLFAMWQATNKASYYDQSWTLQAATYTMPKGQVVDINTGK